MNLKKIQSSLSAYKKHLQSPRREEELYHWETLRNFQENWDTEAVDFAAMYAASLENHSSRRLWRDKDFHPKEAMLQLIQTDPEYARLAFRDLLYEGKDLAGRIGRFIFYCDELLALHRERHKNTKLNSHYHGPRMAMAYLAFRHPGTHTLYHAGAFRHFLQFVEAKDISEGHDWERFQKVTKVLHNFIRKDADLVERIENRLDGRHYTGENRLPVYECLWVLGGKRG